MQQIWDRGPGVGLDFFISAVPAIESLCEIERQQRAFVEDGLLHGKTLSVPDECVAPEHKNKVFKGRPSCGGEIGHRTAQPRWPQTSRVEKKLFDNHPENLLTADRKRNIGVGEFMPSMDEAFNLLDIEDALVKHVFNKENVDKATMHYESLQGVLPNKLGAEARLHKEVEALNEPESVAVSYSFERTLIYSKYVDAFVKGEVSDKDKPRLIANHKLIRLAALGRVAWTFDHIMFDVLERMSIKHREKATVIEEMATYIQDAFAGDPRSRHARMRCRRKFRCLENDFSSFDFSISGHLKAVEARILSAIADHIGLSTAELGVSSFLFERVIGERNQPVTWRMSFTDSTGCKGCFMMEQDRAMRESGDRLTSSGNFLQNLLGWMSYLVAPGHMDEAVQSMVANQGSHFEYMSARDHSYYVMALFFEGDDTYGATEEEAIYTKSVINGVERFDAEHFFFRWGFAPKIDFKATQGFDFCRFVGYDTLIYDGEFVYEGGGVSRRLVMQPDLKRILSTKSWTLQDAPKVALKFATRTYARSYGYDFRFNEPAHAFMRSLFDSNELNVFERAQIRCLRLRDDFLSSILFRVGVQFDRQSTENVADLLQAQDFPDCLGSTDMDRHLTRLAVGEFTALEWATACAPPSFDVHGADLAAHYPSTWT